MGSFVYNYSKYSKKETYRHNTNNLYNYGNKKSKDLKLVVQKEVTSFWVSHTIEELGVLLRDSILEVEISIHTLQERSYFFQAELFKVIVITFKT